MTFDRDEDLNVGWDGTLEAGPSLKSLGATTDGAFGRFSLQKSWTFRSHDVSLWRLMGESRWQQQNLKNGQGLVQNFNSIEINQGNTFILVEDLQLGYNLDPEQQFLLGGDTGLRGYSVRQFSGNKKILMTLENRHNWIQDWMQLVNLGWGVFIDSGGVWKPHQAMDFGDLKSDVGVGLRLAPSKSFDPSIIRMDVATPLDSHQHTSQWVINIGGSYYFGKPEEKKFDQ